jgi:hypothetical protein
MDDVLFPDYFDDLRGLSRRSLSRRFCEMRSGTHLDHGQHQHPRDENRGMRPKLILASLVAKIVLGLTKYNAWSATRDGGS